MLESNKFQRGFIHNVKPASKQWFLPPNLTVLTCTQWSTMCTQRARSSGSSGKAQITKISKNLIFINFSQLKVTAKIWRREVKEELLVFAVCLSWWSCIESEKTCLWEPLPISFIQKSGFKIQESDENCVGNSLLQIWKQRFGHKAKLLFRLWSLWSRFWRWVKELNFGRDSYARFGQYFESYV